MLLPTLGSPTIPASIFVPTRKKKRPNQQKMTDERGEPCEGVGRGDVDLSETGKFTLWGRDLKLRGRGDFEFGLSVAVEVFGHCFDGVLVDIEDGGALLGVGEVGVGGDVVAVGLHALQKFVGGGGMEVGFA